MQDAAGLQPSDLSRQSLYVKFDPLVDRSEGCSLGRHGLRVSPALCFRRSASPPHGAGSAAAAAEQPLPGTPTGSRAKLLDFATPDVPRGGYGGAAAAAAGDPPAGSLLMDTPAPAPARRGVAFNEAVQVKDVTPARAALFTEAGTADDDHAPCFPAHHPGLWPADVQARVAEALKQAAREAQIVQMETEDLQKRLAAEAENSKQMAYVCVLRGGKRPPVAGYNARGRQRGG